MTLDKFGESADVCGRKAIIISMRDESAELIESSQKANEIPSGWEGLAEKADDFDEERARGLVGEAKRLSPEQLKMKVDFAPEHLAEISDDEYIKLLQEVPAAFSTHVTRQGVRDHYTSENHSEGLNQYYNGFVDILESDKKLQSALGASLNSDDLETGMQKFLVLDKIPGRDYVTYKHPYLREDNFWSGGFNAGFVDKATVHLAADTTLEEFYGAEEGNEIFFVFPGAMITSQYGFSSGYGFSSNYDNSLKHMGNDQWVYVDGQKGIDVDAGFTFIPKNTMVDRKTGSKYQLDENREPIIDSETNALKLATDVVPAQEYWQGYFDEHPDLKPAHIVYYGEEEPSEALENWKETNGITKPITEPDFGFKENKLRAPKNEQKLIRDLEQVHALAMEVADNYYPKDKIEPVSDNIFQGYRDEIDEETAAKIADNEDLREAMEKSDIYTTYGELMPYLSAESLVKHADLLHAKGVEYDVNGLIPQLGKNFIDDNIERLVTNGCNVNQLFDRSLEAGYQSEIKKLGDDVNIEEQEEAFNKVVYGFVATGQAAEYLVHGLDHEAINKMIEIYSDDDKGELWTIEKSFEEALLG